MDENYLSNQIINAAIEVHQWLGGPGLLESVYEKSLAKELRDRNFKIQQQVSFPIEYKEEELNEKFR